MLVIAGEDDGLYIHRKSNNLVSLKQLMQQNWRSTYGSKNFLS